MTKEDLAEWQNDYENEQLSGGTFILYLKLYIAELEEEQGSIENTICKWTRDIDARSLFHTRCSDSFQLCEDEEILDNDFKFCPYCGGEIELDAE